MSGMSRNSDRYFNRSDAFENTELTKFADNIWWATDGSAVWKIGTDPRSGLGRVALEIEVSMALTRLEGSFYVPPRTPSALLPHFQSQGLGR